MGPRRGTSDGTPWPQSRERAWAPSSLQSRFGQRSNWGVRSSISHLPGTCWVPWVTHITPDRGDYNPHGAAIPSDRTRHGSARSKGSREYNPVIAPLGARFRKGKGPGLPHIHHGNRELYEPRHSTEAGFDALAPRRMEAPELSALRAHPPSRRVALGSLASSWIRREGIQRSPARTHHCAVELHGLRRANLTEGSDRWGR